MTGQGSQAGASLVGRACLVAWCLQIWHCRAISGQGLCRAVPGCLTARQGTLAAYDGHARAMLIMTCHYLRAVPGLALLHHCPQALGVKLIIRTDIIDKRWYATVIKA